MCNVYLWHLAVSRKAAAREVYSPCSWRDRARHWAAASLRGQGSVDEMWRLKHATWRMSFIVDFFWDNMISEGAVPNPKKIKFSQFPTLRTNIGVLDSLLPSSTKTPPKKKQKRTPAYQSSRKPHLNETTPNSLAMLLKLGWIPPTPLVWAANSSRTLVKFSLTKSM